MREEFSVSANSCNLFSSSLPMMFPEVIPIVKVGRVPLPPMKLAKPKVSHDGEPADLLKMP
jgi:hypothetical protein